MTNHQPSVADHQSSVLLVDHEPQTIRLMLEILARKGIGARLAADRRAALDALNGTGCDLAFLSTSLAGATECGNGFKLLDEIRATAELKAAVRRDHPRLFNKQYPPFVTVC